MNTVMKLEGGIKEVYYCDIELITKVPTTTIDNFAERIKHLDFARHDSIITDDEFIEGSKNIIKQAFIQ